MTDKDRHIARLIKYLLDGETIGPLEKHYIREHIAKLDPPEPGPRCLRCDSYGGCTCPGKSVSEQ